MPGLQLTIKGKEVPHDQPLVRADEISAILDKEKLAHITLTARVECAQERVALDIPQAYNGTVS